VDLHSKTSRWWGRLGKRGGGANRSCFSTAAMCTFDKKGCRRPEIRADLFKVMMIGLHLGGGQGTRGKSYRLSGGCWAKHWGVALMVVLMTRRRMSVGVLEPVAGQSKVPACKFTKVRPVRVRGG